ncbi:PLAT/LH2 domain-containing protein [Streptomyces sp. NPDC101490]|uniref:PLAT/LH2 domain-containing protein n=1 Tax=Streptomyces sp. NPDC101490 TaxID=3366143 RepID=UPI0038167413
MSGYSVTVTIGTVEGAGTNADVYIKLGGVDGQSTDQQKLNTAANDFEEGGSYEFTLAGVAGVGDLNYLQMWHQGGESASEMYVTTVNVTDNATGKKYEFDYNGWINNDVTACMPAQGRAASYQVAVYTGDVHNAGTNSNIYLTVKGALGDSGRHLLDSSDNDFEQDTTSNFTLPLAEFGTLQSVYVESDNSGSASGWYLGNIKITDTTTGHWASFVYNNWLEDDHLTATIAATTTG